MQSIRRLYVAKKDAFAHEERRMCADLKTFICTIATI